MEQTWVRFLEGLVAEHKTARDLCLALPWLDSSKLSRWRRYQESYPNAQEVIKLAEYVKRPAGDLLLMVAQAESEWIEFRAQRMEARRAALDPTPRGGPRGSLPRKPMAPPVGGESLREPKKASDNKRRRKPRLLGLGVGLGLALGAMAGPSAHAEPRLSGGILSPRPKAA